MGVDCRRLGALASLVLAVCSPKISIKSIRDSIIDISACRVAIGECLLH